MIARAATLVWRITYARYIMASALALAADLSLFMTLLRLGLHAVPASMAGYTAGLIVHWIISSRLVFAAQALRGAQRKRQKALFVVSTLIGLAITSLIVGTGSHFGLDPRLAKLIAVAVSFQATYLLRRSVVFA
ncbi:MAG: GtrA family protein [Sphingobium sp.]|nr:GtrA family protein [Sphingobium sp.]MBP8671457.1 GtrA family protein [Sphingobium sp.]MBP9158565.1 GtrA family protein [Sphingobium sp.]MCC6481969.1 GtrA family protein [Sphingomonadaceae bacterium]